MSEVRRFDLGSVPLGEDLADAEMVERPTGDYVEYSDYAAVAENLRKAHKDYGFEIRDPCGTIWEEAERLQKELAASEAQIDRIAKHIHYPECWDTAAYPTLEDAVCEITRCDPNQCRHHKEQTIYVAEKKGGGNERNDRRNDKSLAIVERRKRKAYP